MSYKSDSPIRKLFIFVFLTISSTSFSFFIGAATLAGMPPFGGFWSKDAVLASSYSAFGLPMLAAALIGTFLSAFYITRMTVVIFSSKKTLTDKLDKTSLVMSLPPLILSVLSIALIGLLLSWGDRYTGFSTFINLSEEAGKHHVSIWIPIISGLVTLSSVIISWMTYTNKISFNPNQKILYLLESKYHIDSLYNYLVSKIVLRTSKIISAFDRIVINDTGVDGLASLIPFSSLRLKQIQTGKVSTYLMSMTLGLIAVLLYMIFIH